VSEDATRLEAEAAAAAAEATQAKRSPTAAAAAARRKLAALPGSFLTHMTTAAKADGAPFTDIEVAQAANTFLLAGYETTATSLAMTLYYCTATPGTWPRLVAEVEAVLGGRDPTPSDLAESLPFLSACFSEALRLSPPGSATIREAASDLTIHGFAIPKGTPIHNAVFTAQRDPALWGPDADAFVPDRWLAGGGGGKATGAPTPDLLAFGGGSLMCVGQRFALEEAKMTLVRLAARGLSFDLSPGQVPLAMHAPLTYGPAKGVFVTPRLDEGRAAADAAARGVGGGKGGGAHADGGCTVQVK
jgi:cytochrome P450